MVPSAAWVKTLWLTSPSAGNAKNTARNNSDGSSKAAGISRLGKARPRGDRGEPERDIATVSAGIEAINVTLLGHPDSAPPQWRLVQFPCQGPGICLGRVDAAYRRRRHARCPMFGQSRICRRDYVSDFLFKPSVVRAVRRQRR